MNRMRWIGLTAIFSILTAVSFMGASYFLKLSLSVPYELLREMPALVKATGRELTIARVLSVLTALFFVSALVSMAGFFFHKPKKQMAD